MNKGTLIGFISSDIKSETITLKSGESMKKVGFNIACQRKGKDAGADFPRVVAFGKVAEIVEKYLSKGRGCIVQFHIQTSKYTNKDGKTIYQTDLICDEVEFPPIKKSEEQSQEQQAEQTTGNQPSAPDDFVNNIPDDLDMGELPFR